MILDKRSSVRSLLNSKGGHHLTVYLKNESNITYLKSQLRDAIKTASSNLENVLPPSELKNFLEPIEWLQKSGRTLEKMRNNIGVFRTPKSFRVMNVPVYLESFCSLANSFHVKPLLKWLQNDEDFLLLGLEKGAAHLYHGEKYCLRLIDTVIFPESLRSPYTDFDHLNSELFKNQRQKTLETMEWLNDWIASLTCVSQPKLFVAGDALLSSPLFKQLKYRNAVQPEIAYSFHQSDVVSIANRIREILRKEAHLAFFRSIDQFHWADERKISNRNLFEIAKAAFAGRVKKLLISDSVNIFGKIDQNTGQLTLHPTDLDHEDDDILDDLAQMVLAKNGEVVIASRQDMPGKRPAIAILSEDCSIPLSVPIGKAKEPLAPVEPATWATL
jgi:hypothetical protein